MKKRICAAILASSLLLTPLAAAADSSTMPDWLGGTGPAAAPDTHAGSYPPGTTWAADGTPQYPAGTVWNADGTLTGPDGRIYMPYLAVQPVMTAAEATAYLRAQDPELEAASMLCYEQVEQLVRENNLTVLANEQTLAGIEAVDLDEAIEDLEDAVDGLEDAADGLRDLSDEITGAMEDIGGAMDGTAEDALADLGSLGTVGDVMGGLIESIISYQVSVGMGTVASLEMQIATIEGQIEQLEAQIETLEDTDYEPYERQFEAIEDQLVMGAQTAYIGLATLQQNYISLLQQADLTHVKLSEMQTRFRLGQVSDLDVAEVEDAALSVDSAIETLQMNLRNTKGDLNLLLGRPASENFILDALPVIQPAQLAGMSLESDLARGMNRSYEIYAAEQALEDAEDLSREDDGRKHKIRAAEYSLDSAKNSFDQNFRKLFRAVAEKNRLVTVAEQAHALEARKVATEQVKYDRGMNSRNDLIEAQIEEAKAASEVKLAEIDLFSAYMQYEWATRGVMLGASAGR